jgi:hypothetical protein
MSAALIHAKKRLFERYGLTTPIAYLAERIRAGQATFAGHSADPDQGIFFVPDTNEETGETVQIKVVYDYRKGYVITVLPPEWRRVINARKAVQVAKQFHRDLRRNADDADDDFDS